MVLNLMSRLLSPEYFGLFMVIRRWVPVLIPLMTLNLSIGLTRYVGFDPDHSQAYLRTATVHISIVTFFFALFFLVFRQTFSLLFFNDTRFAGVIPVLLLFFIANWVHLLVYGYYRGALQMQKANGLKILFTVFPILLLVAMLHSRPASDSGTIFLYFLLYSIWAIVTALFFLRQMIPPKVGTSTPKADKKSMKEFLLYSIARIPAVFFDSLVYSLPVFMANFKVSLAEAGYMGIVVVSIRFFEILSMPFTIIFLPKFSQLKRREDTEVIRDTSAVVVNFIITFLPILIVTIPGLTRSLLLLWFGRAYLGIADSLALAVLFSLFYVAFGLLRGILDGLYVFPFSSAIGFAGVVTIFVSSLLFRSDLYHLTLAFGLGLAVHGLLSLLVVFCKIRIPLRFKEVSISLVLTAIIACILPVIDPLLRRISGSESIALLPMLGFRLFILAGVFFLFWRRLSWFQTLKQGSGIGTRVGNGGTPRG